MTATMCIEPGCYEVAVGEARSVQYCRPHYRAIVLTGATVLKATALVGNGYDSGVVDSTTGETIAAGGIVYIDPQAVNLPALVASGAVKVVGEVVWPEASEEV